MGRLPTYETLVDQCDRLIETVQTCDKRIELLEGFVTTLWDIIDDIDTIGDAAKSDDALFRKWVERKQAKRWKTGITTDGYTLSIPKTSAEVEENLKPKASPSPVSTPEESP